MHKTACSSCSGTKCIILKSSGAGLLRVAHAVVSMSCPFAPLWKSRKIALFTVPVPVRTAVYLIPGTLHLLLVTTPSNIRTLFLSQLHISVFSSSATFSSAGLHWSQVFVYFQSPRSHTPFEEARTFVFVSRSRVLNTRHESLLGAVAPLRRCVVFTPLPVTPLLFLSGFP